MRYRVRRPLDGGLRHNNLLKETLRSLRRAPDSPSLPCPPPGKSECIFQRSGTEDVRTAFLGAMAAKTSGRKTRPVLTLSNRMLEREAAGEWAAYAPGTRYTVGLGDCRRLL